MKILPHPIIVHFPMALLTVSVFFYWAALRWKGRGFESAYWYTHLVGLAGAALAVVTGLLGAQAIPADSPAMDTVNLHKFLGLGTLAVFTVLAICHWRNRWEYSPRRRMLHTAVQVLGLVLIVATGLFGGELVYSFGIGVK